MPALFVSDEASVAWFRNKRFPTEPPNFIAFDAWYVKMSGKWDEIVCQTGFVQVRYALRNTIGFCWLSAQGEYFRQKLLVGSVEIYVRRAMMG